MPRIPLSLQLRRAIHRRIAEAQDLLIIEFYRSYPEAVIHGGTAIWRCFSSNRFSEDIDLYLKPEYKSLNDEGLLRTLETLGFKVIKFKKTERSLYSKFEWNKVQISAEAVYSAINNYVSKRFELTDGNYIIVYTLPEWLLIREKVDTYLSRRRIRDLYDIYFLLQKVNEKEVVIGDLKRLLRRYKPPINPKELKTLIYTGVTPKLEDMLEEMRKWVG